MSHLTKGVFIMLIIVITTLYCVNRINLRQEENRKDIYENAVRMASQYATMNLIQTKDINSFFDGNDGDGLNIDIDYSAIGKCRDGLDLYMKSRMNTLHSGISNINIPLVGIVGFESVCGELYDGTKLLPMVYYGGKTSNFTDASLNNKIIRFTVGNTVFIKDKEYRIGIGDKIIDTETGNEIDCSAYLNSLGFKSMYDLKNDVVMKTINKFISMYCGNEDTNKTTQNLGYGYDVYLGSSNSTNPSAIEGLGVFAVVDVYSGNKLDRDTRFIRTITFGGAELKIKE